jgi:hypothetical protein
MWILNLRTAKNSLYTMDENPLRLTTDWTIDCVCDKENHYTVPDPIKYQVIMHRFSTRMGSFMSASTPNSSTALLPQGESASLLALLEQEYMELSNRISGKLSCEFEWFPLSKFHYIQGHHPISYTM